MVDGKITKIGYARVSTVDKQTLGLALQIDALTEAGCSPVFSEEVSGSRDDREEMQRAIEIAKQLSEAGQRVAFYIYKLDRLGRHTIKAIQIIEELKAAGVSVVSIKEGFDTTTAAGVLQYQLLASFAEFELNSIRQRTKEGLAQAKKNGSTLGRPAITTKLKNAIIMTYTNSSLSVKVIANKYQLGVSTVYKILRNANVKRRELKK